MNFAEGNLRRNPAAMGGELAKSAGSPLDSSLYVDQRDCPECGVITTFIAIEEWPTGRCERCQRCLTLFFFPFSHTASE